MEMESVFLDNLPDTANMILNILWDKNEEMCTAELTEAVNEVYNRRWEKGLIQEFINLLIRMERFIQFWKIRMIIYGWDYFRKGSF